VNERTQKQSTHSVHNPFSSAEPGQAKRKSVFFCTLSDTASRYWLMTTLEILFRIRVTTRTRGKAKDRVEGLSEHFYPVYV